jgi:hypothetical protein
MRNKLEMVPESVQPEDASESIGGDVEEIEKVGIEEQEQKVEDEKTADSEEKEAEPKVEEDSPEVIAKFRDSLALLHVRIKLRETPEKDFPDKEVLMELINEIPLFGKMELGAKKMLLDALNRDKEFRSADEEEFVDKGMEVLDILIHTATLKEEM